MTEEEKANYLGKYVCHDALDGGACWGRIKDCTVVGTQMGEKDAFILEDRYVRYARGSSRKHHRQFHAISKFEGQDELFFVVEKNRGDSILRLDQIDIDKDVVAIDDFFKGIDTETLFLAFMAGQGQGVDGSRALEIGLCVLLESENISNKVADELRERLHKEKEDV